MNADIHILKFAKYDALVRATSAFGSFEALVNAKGGYRPSLQCTVRGRSQAEKKDVANNIELAEAYDSYMGLIGDERRAFRY